MNQAEMIPCDHVIAKLWEYIDGELTEEHAAKVRAHLEICNRCFPQYDFQRAYKEFLRRCADRPIPPRLRRRVFETILAEEAGSAPPDGSHVESTGFLADLRRLLDKLFSRG